MNQEEAFVRSFVFPDKQARYLEKLASSKQRGAFLDRLNHHLDYDPSFASRVPPSQQTAAKIELLLRKRGAPDVCHIISSMAEWDGLDLPLCEALELVVGYDTGTVLCCISGRLAYYESEGINERFILSR
jgi:hypothetical protein